MLSTNPKPKLPSFLCTWPGQERQYLVLPRAHPSSPGPTLPLEVLDKAVVSQM